MKTTSGFCALLIIALICGGFVALIEAGTSCRAMPTNPDACCKFPRFEKEDEVVAECVKTYGEQIKRERAEKRDGPQRGCCIAECIMNGTGHTDLSAEAMIKIDLQEAKDMKMEADWEPVIRATAESCEAEGKKRADDFEEGFKVAPVDPNDQVCHPKFVFTLLCTVMGNLQSCPAKYFTDTPECRELREFFKTCDM